MSGARLHRRSITTRLVAGMSVSMAVLLALTGAFIYERMSFALNRSIRDVPKANAVEIDARQRHRDEALHELLVQLALAYAGALALSAFIGYRTARTALQPVEAMRRQAAAAPGTTAVRLDVGSNDDELSRLATTLNDLLRRVDEGVAREHQLIADASHELRTPLSGMLMQVDLALARDRSPQETRQALERIRGETQRLIRLANDLLLLARLQELPAVRQRPIDAEELVGTVTAAFHAEHPDVPITLRAGSGAAMVVVDPLGLEQVVRNLLENARRHGAPPITISVDVDAHQVTIHVRDVGSGFPADFIARAFERFSTANTTGPASGLGLAIVAETAQAAGGTVGATSGDGQTDVWIRLPRATAEVLD